MQITKLAGQGMDRREQEKFDRVADSLQATFAAAGCSDVSECKAITIENQRLLYFYRRSENLPLVILTADDFMSGTAEELAALIVLRVEEAKHREEPKKRRGRPPKLQPASRAEGSIEIDTR